MAATKANSIKWDSQPLKLWTEKYAEGNIISLANIQTHYVVKGIGSPVILIHGFFFDSTLWCRNLETLAKSYRVYTLDLWGFGYSAPTSQPSYELYSQQLSLFMQAMGIEKATLIGQSLGGGVAIQFSISFPEKVEKLILVDSAGLPNTEPLAAQLFKMRGVGEMLLNFPGNVLRKKMLKDFFLYKIETLSPELLQHLTWFHKIAGSSASALALMRLGFADKLEATLEHLAALGLPIMIIWGAHDQAIRLKLGWRLHRSLPGSEFFTIQDAGHVPNLEQPGIFNFLVETFIRGEIKPSPLQATSPLQVI